MKRFLLVFGFTLRQLAGRRRSIVLLLLALTPAAMGVIARRFGAPYPDRLFLDIVPSIFTGFLVQVVCLFYGASVVRDAIEDRTAVFMLTTPTSRSCYVLGTWTALVFNVLILLVLAVAAAFLTWGAGLGEPFSGGVLFGPECLSLMGAVAAGVLVYSALFMLLGMYTRHCAVVGVVFYMISDVFLGTIPGPARRLAISSHLDTLLHPRFRTRQLFTAELSDNRILEPISPTVATAVLAVLAVALVSLLLMRAARQDFMDLGEPAR